LGIRGSQIFEEVRRSHRLEHHKYWRFTVIGESQGVGLSHILDDHRGWGHCRCSRTTRIGRSNKFRITAGLEDYRFFKITGIGGSQESEGSQILEEHSNMISGL
jgi:hypothetical protein